MNFTQPRHIPEFSPHFSRNRFLRFSLAAILVCSVVFTLLLTLVLARSVAAQSVAAEDSNVLSGGEPVRGEVVDRFGEEWIFSACAGDVVTLTMQSDEFSAYLELFPPTGRRSLAESEADGDTAMLQEIELEESGEYTVIAAGERRSDAGEYTLALSYNDSATDDSATGDAAKSADGWLLPNEVVSGTIRTRFGDEWAFRGCKGDIVDIDLESDEFDTYLELYGPSDRQPLIEDDDGGRRSNALIEAFELDQNGTFVIVAGGATRSDVGEYLLTLAVEHAYGADSFVTSTVEPTATATRVPTKRPTVRPTRRPTATRTPTRTPTPEPEVCSVQVNRLNLRSGPGVVYDPPIGGIPRNAELIPLSRNAAGAWIEVEVASNGQRGWVSSAPQYVDCTFEISELPLGIIPPTPIPTPTPTPTATPTVAASPTPTPPAFVILPGGGDPGPFEGDVVAGAGTFSVGSSQPTFRDRIYFRLLVKERGRSSDGDGVDRVEISVRFQPNNGNERQVYSRTERTPGYCSFGGGEPNCDVVRIGRDARWPDTDTPIENGNYEVNFSVVRDGENSPSANWRVPFVISNSDLPDGGPGAGPADIVARVAQTGPGTTATLISGRAVFQVEAYDPSRGSRDGDGIENIDMSIVGPDGRTVYQRTENSVAYCAFSGGEPDCEIWDFNASGRKWPSGESLQPGFHRLVARVNAEDGRQKTVELTVEIR